MEESRICSKCGQEKPLSEFKKGYNTRVIKGELRKVPYTYSFCNDCKKVYFRNYRQAYKVTNPVPLTEKECCRCHRILPIENFNKKCDTKDGWHPQCRSCAKEMRYLREKDRPKNTISKEKSLLNKIIHYEQKASENRRKLSEILMDNNGISLPDSFVEIDRRIQQLKKQ